MLLSGIAQSGISFGHKNPGAIRFTHHHHQHFHSHGAVMQDETTRRHHQTNRSLPNRPSSVPLKPNRQSSPPLKHLMTPTPSSLLLNLILHPSPVPHLSRLSSKPRNLPPNQNPMAPMASLTGLMSLLMALRVLKSPHTWVQTPYSPSLPRLVTLPKMCFPLARTPCRANN